MMVPRAYHYASPPHVSPSMLDEKKEAAEKRNPRRDATKKAVSTRPAKPPRMCTAPPSTPSQPVVIPTRSSNTRPRVTGRPISPARKRKEDDGSTHNPDAQRPSMAALLSVTSIPTPRSLSVHRKSANRERRESSIKVIGSVDPDELRPSFSSFSPRSWELLQSSPNDTEDDQWSIGSDSTIAPLSSFRSLSSNSIPSLDIDLDSPESVSGPSTPKRRLSKRDQRHRTVSVSLAEDCGIDHPLSPGRGDPRTTTETEVHPSDTDLLQRNVSTSVLPPRYSFKSNLTASLQVLKSAARSFSNIANPVMQRDEQIVRSILTMSPPFTDERRPAPSQEIPDPALRRYLNPISGSISEFHFHHAQTPDGDREDICTGAIQLQTYHRGATPSKNATAPPVFVTSAKDVSENEAATDSYSSSRQREPRENSDFLRVIVLEMNMRKAGKLNESAAGRARIWLPPRQVWKPQETETSGIPRRWSGIVS